MKFDLHLHTTRHSSDSAMDPFLMLNQARKIGLDGVVITEHDWLWTEPELKQLRAAAPELAIFSGIEVSAVDGHFLVYGVHDPFALAKGIGVAELCREVHRQGGAVVAAHPFRWGQPFEEILREEQPELDGLELMTSNMDAECRRRAAEVHRRRPLAGMGSSDAHREETLGCCYTEFPDPVRDLRDLVEAIRTRQVRAHERIPLAVGSR
jgi:predicted metal-dependent phosphoesterase TrpH